MIERLSDLMFRTANDVKILSKHASMVQTRLEQIARSQNDLLDEMNNKNNNHAVRVVTRGGRMTRDPLYPEGHPKRIEQDSQRINNETPSSLKKKKKKKNKDRALHASSEPTIDTPGNPNYISISDAETQYGDEHEPSDNVNDDFHDDPQPSNDNDVEI